MLFIIEKLLISEWWMKYEGINPFQVKPFGAGQEV